MRAADPRQRRREQQQQGEADHEYDPSLEIVQHAFGHVHAPVLDGDTDQPDTQAVEQNRNRNAREEQHHALPGGGAEEIRQNERERHQRKQVAQAAACLHDLQLEGAEIDDVAVQEHADSEQADHVHSERRRQQLQPQGQGVGEERRQRDREYQNEQRHLQPAEDGRADQRED